MATKIKFPFPFQIPLDSECSICLEEVVDNNFQAIVKLKCGHIFHLSCVGSEFNIKGLMQCPNCRAIEDNYWLFCVGAPELEIEIVNANENTDEEMGDNDENQNQNQNISLCPHGLLYRPGLQHDDHGSLPDIRPTRALQIGGNGSNVVFPNVPVHQHSNLVPLPPAPQSTHSLASNAATSGLANGILNYSPPAILDPDGQVSVRSAAFTDTFDVNESSLIPLNLDPQPPSSQALLASRGPFWSPQRELNLFGLEPSVFNIGSSSASTSADPLELTLACGTFMEQEQQQQMLVCPHGFYCGMQGRPFETMDTEDPNADAADP